MTVVVLSGGTGGAKLARGMLDVVGDQLVVVANTGDDLEVYGAHVSPDPDLVTFWLADRIDPRGWGLAGDTFAVMEGLRELGVDVWFSLGDRDLAIGLERRRRMAEGASLTDTLGELGAALGLRARVLPMSDQAVRTRVATEAGWRSLQEFLIRDPPGTAVVGVEFGGAETARPAPEALTALEQAEAIIIGPSNPVISIGPILAVPGVREALRRARAPVIAVSPVVGGAILKGPTAGLMAWAGAEVSAAGVAALYGDLLDGMVADESVPGLPTLATDLLMTDGPSRRRLAQHALDFARGFSQARR